MCTKQGIHIPWDDVAGEINDFLTGDAIKQHLAKLAKHRELAGQPVPQKAEKTPRRKNKQSATTATETPATSRKKGKKSSLDSLDASDIDDDDSPSRGNTLLWHDPPADKKKKTPKKPSAVSKTEVVTVTPVASPGKSNKKGKEEGTDKTVSHTRTKSTGKRSRKTKQVANSSDEDVLAGSESPTKKQKTISLRPTVAVDYKEHLSDDDVFGAAQVRDDDGHEHSQAPKKKSKKSTVKKESSEPAFRSPSTCFPLTLLQSPLLKPATRAPNCHPHTFRL